MLEQATNMKPVRASLMFPGALADFDAHMTAVRLEFPIVRLCLRNLVLEIVWLHLTTALTVLSLTMHMLLRLGYRLWMDLTPLCRKLLLVNVTPIPVLPKTTPIRVGEPALQIGMARVLTDTTVILSVAYR